MQGFLFLLGLMSILIAFGVFLSLRLNKRRLVGKRRPVRARSIQTVAAAEEYGTEEVYESFGPTVSTSSIRARSSLVVFIAGAAIILTLVAGLLNILPH